MTEHLTKQEILQITGGCVRTRGEHNLEECNKEDLGEDSGSDYVSAESDAEDDQKKMTSGENEGKDGSTLSNSGIKRKTQPKSIIIPSSEELEICGGRHNSCSFVPTHPGLPVMPSVPPPSPQEKAQIAAREGKVDRLPIFNVTFINFIAVATYCKYRS